MSEPERGGGGTLEDDTVAPTSDPQPYPISDPGGPPRANSLQLLGTTAGAAGVATMVSGASTDVDGAALGFGLFTDQLLGGTAALLGVSELPPALSIGIALCALGVVANVVSLVIRFRSGAFGTRTPRTASPSQSY